MKKLLLLLLVSVSLVSCDLANQTKEYRVRNVKTNIITTVQSVEPVGALDYVYRIGDTVYVAENGFIGGKDDARRKRYVIESRYN